MQTRNFNLSVVVGEYYDAGGFRIYGGVVRRRNNVLTSIARSNRERLKRSCVQKFSNPLYHEQEYRGSRAGRKVEFGRQEYERAGAARIDRLAGLGSQ